jgi:DNA polymerase-3 subunit epsilon
MKKYFLFLLGLGANVTFATDELPDAGHKIASPFGRKIAHPHKSRVIDSDSEGDKRSIKVKQELTAPISSPSGAAFSAVFSPALPPSGFMLGFENVFLPPTPMMPKALPPTMDFSKIFSLPPIAPSASSAMGMFPRPGTVIFQRREVAPFKVRAVSDFVEKPFAFNADFLKKRGYRREFLTQISGNPVRIFFDTETTGLYAEDRMIEIAFIKCNFKTMMETRWYSLLNPEGKTSAPKAFEAHHIHDAWLTSQPKFSDVVDDMLRFIGDDILVAHNAQFDQKMLNQELIRCGRTPLDRDQFDCTLKKARKIFPGENNKLDAVCERYGVDLSIRSECHGSMQDSILLRDIFPSIFVEHAELEGATVEKV